MATVYNFRSDNGNLTNLEIDIFKRSPRHVNI